MIKDFPRVALGGRSNGFKGLEAGTDEEVSRTDDEDVIVE
ncbi:hypothetical protein A2U01_0103048, partial [Trifolium medium]|nr:hypothetical protein [Trifolium medium]